MRLTDYKPRLIDAKLEHYLQTFGAIAIEDPKWSGKTWTAARRAQSAIYIGDPANQFSNRRLAELDTNLALEGEQPRLIDEWQEMRL